MKVKLKGNTLSIETELNSVGASRSGRSTMLATTHGQQYIGNVNGKPTYLQVNVMQMESGAAGSGTFELIGASGDVESERGERKRAA